MIFNALYIIYELLNTALLSMSSSLAILDIFWPSPNPPLQCCLRQVQIRPQFSDPSGFFRLLFSTKLHREHLMSLAYIQYPVSCHHFRSSRQIQRVCSA